MVIMTEFCTPVESNFSENIHYYYQFCYLFMAICLNYRILYTIWVSHRQFYSNQSFYNLYSIDSIMSICSMSFDLLFTRIFLFFPQFCGNLSQIVGKSVIFMRVLYVSQNYFKSIKSVIHIFVALNRMSCVIFPVTYSQNWSGKMRLMVVIIFLSPLLIIWNVLISDNYLVYANGGFAVTYDRRVKWASLSMMQFTLIIITVIITMTTTVITFYKMSKMKKRIKASERSLCIAAGLISIGFLMESVTQSLFAFFKGEVWMMNIIIYVQFTSWDFLTIASPLVLLIVSHQFRSHVFSFSFRKGRTQRVSSINNTITHHHHPHPHHHTLTRCLSAKMEKPTECMPVESILRENIHYYYQFVYSFASICLNYRILYTIWVSHRQFYSNQSFYTLYSIDCAFGVVSFSIDLITYRIFLFFPQFCPFLTKLVGNSPIFMKVVYCFIVYSKAIKPIIHIFLALNRMSCVMFPITYSKNWAGKTSPILAFIFLSPFLIIWNTVISRIYVRHEAGGFLLAYERRVEWASLSMMQFTLIIITVIITMTTTVITFYKMSKMKIRLKASERSLCIAAGLISVGFLMEAITQSLFAFYRGQEWMLKIIVYIQFATWDILTAGSPLVLLLVSYQFRCHVFNLRRARTQRIASIATPQNNTIVR